MQPRILLPLAALASGLRRSRRRPTRRSRPPSTATTLTSRATTRRRHITLNVNAAGLITHNFRGAGSRTTPTSTPAPAIHVTLPNNGTVIVNVNAGGGNDTINSRAPNLVGATINGGAGDDIIVGTDGADTIPAAPATTAITGFRGGDTIHGGDGNDVMIWNNGDGSDTNDGGDDVDETLITAAAADDNMTVKPSADGAASTAPNAGRSTSDMNGTSRSSRSRPSAATTR